MVWLILFLAIVAILAYIRLAPSDPARWHVSVTDTTSRDADGLSVRVLPGDRDTLARLNEEMVAPPRTRVLAGSVEEGRITYITRSRGFGFPDYTTIEQTDGQVRLKARLRFGRSDLGVNRARLEGLVSRLQS
jgi:uncharacterized protein (DUF1499 family)